MKLIPFKDALSERYLAYALSTITARSLPDVRDGLKPVHRRLLYAMLQLKLDPDSGYKKCARVVGDVIGKYHPHGDSAVYDTLVRLAQTFAVRYPLVDGQGNFGSVDGDNAAAMRYTEARLTAIAMALLEGIDADTVDFRATYDGEDHEPVVLPASVPNLLANGSEGIAVGMATSIPPHNIGELCEGLLLLLRKPSASVAELLEVIPGPDFPTGGFIAENPAVIRQAYETGRGSIRVRARWEKENLSHGLYQIVITEIPYQVPKSRLIEHIAELFRNKKLPLVGNIRDESAETMRVVLEPKSRSVDAEMLMESLFKVTDLQTRFSLNLNVLTAKGMPQVMNLRQLLEAFLEHRFVVLERRSRYRLSKIADRLEVLGGLLVAYLNIDEVIRIIREEDEPKPVMMKKWKLSDRQVEAILNMRLRSLRKLEEIEIKREQDALLKEKEQLQLIIDDEKEARRVIRAEIKDVQKQFGGDDELGRRRTEFADAPSAVEISIEAFIEKEPITIVYSKMGWIRAFKGHFDSFDDLKFKEGDEMACMLKARTTDKILFFASNGRFYTLTGDRLPRGKGFGEPLRLMIDLPNEDDIVEMHVFEGGRKMLLASDHGKGFLVEEDAVLASTRGGKQVLSLSEGMKAVVCQIVNDEDMVAAIGTHRKMLAFPLSQLPLMGKGQGVQLMKLKDARLSDVKVFSKSAGLSWMIGDRVRTETDVTPWLADRATQGKLPPVGFPRSNRFS
ncbi:MAG: DNA topoisomerase IV subunit A [Rickettsiales bacterium]|nr:DNA topoisomerase IV subunit A [Rickettsiales bacterium]